MQPPGIPIGDRQLALSIAWVAQITGLPRDMAPELVLTNLAIEGYFLNEPADRLMRAAQLVGAYRELGQDILESQEAVTLGFLQEGRGVDVRAATVPFIFQLDPDRPDPNQERLRTVMLTVLPRETIGEAVERATRDALRAAETGNWGVSPKGTRASGVQLVDIGPVG